MQEKKVEKKVEKKEEEKMQEKKEEKVMQKNSISMLLQEATRQNGSSVMGRFKTTLLNVLKEHEQECQGQGKEVTPLPVGAVIRFFIKHTDIFHHLPAEARYNRAFRYMQQVMKAIDNAGWEVVNTKPRMLRKKK